MLLIQFSLAFYFYPRMPERMAIRQGPSREPTRYGSGFIGLYLLPIASTGIFLLFMALLRLDLTGNIQSFRQYSRARDHSPLTKISFKMVINYLFKF